MTLLNEESRFVTQGREYQLNWLDARLARLLEGEAQVVFVAGDAGVGKTWLVREFCNRAQQKSKRLVVAWGECSSPHGTPYLPFRDILALLCGNVEGRTSGKPLSKKNANRLKRLVGHTGEALIELGPDLVGTFVPVAGLLLKASALLVKKVGWLKPLEKLLEKPRISQDESPERLFEQYRQVLMRLAQDTPLVLVVEDLHWADTGTLDLLFYLARRMLTSRVPLLLIGTCRLAELAMGRNGCRHPLQSVLNELQRYWGDIQLDLTATIGGRAGRAFVDALVKSESEKLDASFCQTLFQRTEGHPLFTVELLHTLQERGALERDAQGQWVVTRSIVFADLPEKVEAVIHERIGRVSPELRDIIVCGAVEGEIFTAEVVARVLRRSKTVLAKRLEDDLAGKHRLIMYQGEQIVGAKRLHRYGFRHALFQQHLYAELGPLQREQLHASVGAALEKIYGSKYARGIAATLAVHFDLAQQPKRALDYYHQAADQAAEAFAWEDALRLFNRGVELLDQAPNTQLRFDLLAGRRRVSRLLGKRDDEAEDIEELLSIARDAGDPIQIASVLNWKASHYAMQSDYATAMQVAQEGLLVARSTGDAKVISACLARIASVARWQGDLFAALDAAREAVALARSAQNQSAEAECLANLGVILWDLGRGKEAQAVLEEARDIYQVLGDPEGQSNCLYMLSYVFYDYGDYSASCATAEQALNLVRRLGNRRLEAEALCSLGASYIDLGEFGKAISYYDVALELYQSLQDRRGEAVALFNRGLALYFQRRYAAALMDLRQALDIGLEIGGRKTQAFVLNYMGLVYEDLGQYAEAAADYADAMQLRQDLYQEARLADYLAGLLRCALGQGKYEEAREYLNEIIDQIGKQGIARSEYPLLVGNLT